MEIVPSNFIHAMSENDILAVMFFALIFGIGFLVTDPERTRVLKQAGIEGVFEIAMKLIGLVIRLAPLAIFCFMFNLAALFGWDLIVRLSAYVGVVLLALSLQMFGVFPALLALLGADPRFLPRNAGGECDGLCDRILQCYLADLAARCGREAEAASPHCPVCAHHRRDRQSERHRNVRRCDRNLPRAIFRVDLSLGQQLTVMMICILGGIGTAGVPAGSLPVIALILGTIGVPPEGIGLVLGVDRLLDMCRTTLNVVGDLVAAQVISAQSASVDQA